MMLETGVEEAAFKRGGLIERDWNDWKNLQIHITKRTRKCPNILL